MISPKDAWTVFRKVEALLELEEKHGKAIAALQDQIDALADCVTRLETHDEVLIAKAQAAAGMAAMGAMADISRRVGGMEARAQMADAAHEPPKRLPGQRTKAGK